VVLDVWEPEPDLNVELLNKVDIGTAHIAGYTLEGKRADDAGFEAYSAFIGHPQQVALDTCCRRRNLAALPCTARSIRQR
jgi:erythronate-4-phosphate dehydrogenase